MNILEPIERNFEKHMSSTHVGKIARLPKRIREELNRRLDEGEDGGSILRWLNSTEEVKYILAAKLGIWNGRVNKQNLSHWRQGGYREWLRQNERRDIALLLVERGVELGEEMDGVDLANHLSAVLVADYAAAIQRAQAGDLKPAEQCAQLKECLLTVAKVRREDYLTRKLAMEWAEYLKEQRAERMMENGIRRYGSAENYYLHMQAQEQVMREAQMRQLEEREGGKQATPDIQHPPKSEKRELHVSSTVDGTEQVQGERVQGSGSQGEPRAKGTRGRAVPAPEKEQTAGEGKENGVAQVAGNQLVPRLVKPGQGKSRVGGGQGRMQNEEYVGARRWQNGE